MEVYVDDMMAKSWAKEDREFEESVWQIAEIQSSNSSAKAYKAGRRFGASSGKLLGFIVSRREIEVDLQKPKQLSTCRYQEWKKGLGRLQYISKFIAQLTPICEPIFKLLRKKTPSFRSEKIDTRNEDCQKAFHKVKKYLLNSPRQRLVDLSWWICQ